MQRENEEKEQKIALLEEGKNNADAESSNLRATLRKIEASKVECQRELEEARRQVGG